MILGFIVAHIGIALIIFGFIMPRWYDILIPPPRRAEGTEGTVACEPKGEVVARAIQDNELDADRSSSEEKGFKNEAKDGPSMQRL